MSDTPRTDAFEKWWKVWGNHVSKVFVYARNLECEIYETQEELAEAKKDADRWRHFLKNPFAAWDHINEALDVNSPAYWKKQANAAIDAAMKEVK